MQARARPCMRPSGLLGNVMPKTCRGMLGHHQTRAHWVRLCYGAETLLPVDRCGVLQAGYRQPIQTGVAVLNIRAGRAADATDLTDADDEARAAGVPMPCMLPLPVLDKLGDFAIMT